MGGIRNASKVTCRQSTAELWEQVAEQRRWNWIARSAFDHTGSRTRLREKYVFGRWLLARRAGHDDAATDSPTPHSIDALLAVAETAEGAWPTISAPVNRSELAAPALRDLVVQASYGGDDAPEFFYVARSYAAAVNDLDDQSARAS